MGSIFNLVVGLAVIGYVFLTNKKAQEAERRVEELRDRLHHWGNETRASMEEIRGQISRVEFEIKRNSGGIQISADMKLADLMSIHPGVKMVLAKHHLGGCSSCSTSKFETLAQAASAYGLNLDEIMADLRLFMNNPEGFFAAQGPPAAPPSLQIQVPTRS